MSALLRLGVFVTLVIKKYANSGRQFLAIDMREHDRYNCADAHNCIQDTRSSLLPNRIHSQFYVYTKCVIIAFHQRIIVCISGFTYL